MAQREVKLRSVGLRIAKEDAEIACPRLSAGGKLIGTSHRALSPSGKPSEILIRDNPWRWGKTMRLGQNLYSDSDRKIYIRPHALRVDTYC
jgi:hypothetical protein